MANLKSDVQVVNQQGLYYIVDNGNRIKRFKPWLGGSSAFLYDSIMRHSVFPNKFGANIQKHFDILSQALAGARGKRLLELATGSGSASRFLSSDNRYTGTDISPGLLKQAEKRFRMAGFPEPEFYVVSADQLPFENGSFDLCLCILAMNFFGNIGKVFQEIKRLLVPGGTFVCCVPVPERNLLRSTIRGALYSQADYQSLCQEHHFRYAAIPGENGALLYFMAIREA
jgi:SAM-dependent methyltransferase